MASHILSKSTYIRGIQCTKSLYLNKFRPYLRDLLSSEQLAKFARGHAVGKVAQQLFPGGVLLGRPSKSAAEKTQQLISEGVSVIYEACFVFDDVMIALDILVHAGDFWQAYEVKSSYALSETYYNDAALQFFVLKGSGLNINKINLVYRNPDVIVPEHEFNPEGFLYEDVTRFCESQISVIGERIESFKHVLQLDKSPDIQPGTHCLKPYPCDFRGVCWKKLTDSEKKELIQSVTAQEDENN